MAQTYRNFISKPAIKSIKNAFIDVPGTQRCYPYFYNLLLPNANNLFFPTITFITLLLATFAGKSQTLHRPVSAVYNGLGAYSIKHADLFSVTANQASLAQLDYGGVALYGERRFMLAELNCYRAVFALPTRSGNFGLNAGYSGFTEFNETQFGLVYARKLGKKLDIGAQFNYNGIRIGAYGSAAAISFELGTIMHVSERLHAGIHINNPVGGKFGEDQQEKLSSVYTIGIGYEASDKFFISSEIVKEEDQPVNVNAGLQYKFLPQLLVRTGVSTATSTVWMGTGLSWKSFRIDVSASFHQQLGITPGLLVLFNFKSKEH
jgi:hypothetical protein